MEMPLILRLSAKALSIPPRAQAQALHKAKELLWTKAGILFDENQVTILVVKSAYLLWWGL